MGLGSSMDVRQYCSFVHNTNYYNPNTTSKEMTQEEFLKKYGGKNIEVYTAEDRETVWMFNVRSADFSKGNEIFLGWISAEKSIFGYPDKIELYSDPAENDELILRPEDKITVFETAEKLQERIIEHVKKHLLCEPKQK